MRALGSRRPQLPATSFHLPASFLFLAFLLLAFVARGGEPLPSASRDQGKPLLVDGARSNSSAGAQRRDLDRETGRGETWTLVGEERRRDVGDGSSDDRKRKEEEEEEAEGAVKKRRRNDVGKSAEEGKEESEGIRRFDGGEGARVIPGYFRKSGKLEEEEAGEEEGGSEEEAPCNESSEVEGRGYRSLLEPRVGGAKNRKSSTVYLSAEEKRISDGEQQSIVDGQIKRLISIRDDALDARAKADEMDEAKVLNFKREVEPEVQRGDKGNNGQKSGKARDLQEIRLLTPDTLVYNILQDALETYQSEEPRISYIDINNDTLKKLVTTDQLYILRMAEKFLPQTLRLDYSEKMFSCVRRFEYYSCVKYIAWPMIKQYFPALPPFPDFHTWYPIIDVYPVFSPLPAYLEGVPADLELPEVVDADDSKTGKKNGPEATIIQILHNVLKDRRADPHPSPAPSFLDRSADIYIAFLFDDRSVTINLTERSIPISYRARFAQNTIRCAKEYDYLACFKYSVWPMVKRIAPDAFTPPSEHVQSPVVAELVPKFVVYLPTVLAKGDGPAYLLPFKEVEGGQRGGTRLSSSDELETKMLDALAKVRDSVDAAREMSTFILTGDAATYTISFTRRQMEILRLAEYLVPPSARPILVLDVLSYLRGNADFVDCARHVIWPTVAKHVADFPDFPRAAEEAATKGTTTTTNAQRSAAEGSVANSEERRVGIGGKEKKASAFFQDGKEPRIPSVAPVISVSGTRFVPIFTELPETVILNILRAIQFQSINPNVPISSPPFSSAVKNPQFFELLTEQQANIVNITNALLPASIRPEFANKMIDCLRENSFLVCTRDVAWPILLQYFPWLPNFPNFGIVASSTSTTNSSTTATITDEKSTLTEVNPAPPLSETNVKTRQHGDTTVTITDTRFVPILNDLPETIILNILKAVQLSVPNLPAPPDSISTEDAAYPPHLTEHQISIMSVARNLLPIQTRAELDQKILPCLGERSFLECTRDLTWPTIAQTYPWLPSFPNFTTLGQTSPQTHGSIRFQFLLEKSSAASRLEKPAERTNDSSEREGGVEERMEEVLLNILGKSEDGSMDRLNATDLPALSERQAMIVRRIEEGIPEAERSTYVTRMLDCSARYSFAICVNNIGWPILKRYNSSIPDLSTLTDLFSHLVVDAPRIPQSLPDASPSSQPSGISQIEIAKSSTEASSSPSSSSSSSSSRSSLSGEVEGQDPGNGGQEEEDSQKKGNPANTPSVDNGGIIPEYAGQPTGIPIDISSEKVHAPAIGIVQEKPEGRGGRRERRSTMELRDSYYDTDYETAGRFSSNPMFPNITESEYLRLLIRVKEKTKSSSRSKQYLVDNLNSTIRDSLTADQYEILKIVEDLDGQASSKGLASQTMNCILSLSFIRCLAIFVWPLIASNFPTLGILGRSLNINGFRRNDPGRSSLETEKQMQEFFAMSTTEFEKELLKRKESIEKFFLDLYRMLTEEKFETSIGYFKIKGYGKDGAPSSREGRGAKLKDNKNLPSILTIISDIMEEVLDQRPEGERAKKEKEKKERSIEGSRESDVQSLKNGQGYMDIKRSMNDDEIITMFLDKIKSNDSDEVAVEEEGDEGTGYLASEDAYNAFEVLFGTKLHDKLARETSLLPLDSSRSSESAGRERNGSIEPIKRVNIVSLESRKRVPNGGDESKLSPIKDRVAYDFEKELSEGQEERRRKKRAKAYFKSFLERYSSRDRRLRDVANVEDNAIDGDENQRSENDEGSTLIVRLPRLRDEDASRKGTAASLSKAFKSKMSEMMPGFGLVLSFLLQLALAHARATASVAGMISNMALGTAMFGMMRDSLFGTSNNPKIKYVYDNDKTGPGISWPAQYEYAPHYYG